MLKYEFDSPELKMLCKKHHLERFGKKTQLATMSEIMHFVFESLSEGDDGGKMLIVTQFSSLTIDKIKENSNRKLSCWVYSLYLTECFLSIGIPARMIRCLSGLKFDNECHCVVVAYCDEYKKNVLFDVANNTVYYSYTGEPLSLPEFRDYIINKKRIFYIQKGNHDKESLINYWVKNLSIFQSYEIQRYGNELGLPYIEKNRILYLLPQNLKASRKWIHSVYGLSVVVTRNQKAFWGI